MKKVNLIEAKEGNEVDNLAMDAATLQAEIDRRTESLQKCLRELEEKKELSKNRSTFIHVLENLQEAENCLNEEGGFDSSDYKLKFLSTARYNNDELFSIGNREIIIEFLLFIREKIRIKIEDIEKKLIA